MTNANSTLQVTDSRDAGFNLNLIRTLFSDPLRDRDNAVVVSNHDDIVAGISAGDLLLIDFTDSTLDNGLYIITLDDGWIGYRFFECKPSLYMRDSESSYLVTPAMLDSIKVVGKVKDIYRSVNKGE